MKKALLLILVAILVSNCFPLEDILINDGDNKVDTVIVTDTIINRDTVIVVDTVFCYKRDHHFKCWS